MHFMFGSVVRGQIQRTGDNRYVIKNKKKTIYQSVFLSFFVYDFC